MCNILYLIKQRNRAVAARQAHYLKAAGSNPASETLRMAQLGTTSLPVHNTSMYYYVYQELIKDVDLSKRGHVTEVAKRIACSHTHARRFINNHLSVA